METGIYAQSSDEKYYKRTEITILGMRNSELISDRCV